MKLIKSLAVLALVLGLINGGLWLYYKTANGEEHARLDMLGEWLDKTEADLDELQEKAQYAETQEEYDSIVSDYNFLADEYNRTASEYNEISESLEEFYLLPMPGKGGK
ncbi:hypothetical protein PUS82_02325 [Cytobacillus firmus]|uniref:hypothetical protein n=1 Tax=Cytobacillus firmus TaxID=1399 RepID=UPI0018CD19FF|nr:hypothetical protein [Cytobacillus firmus]MBG9548833.1 hypothetical protein [Cytobacillus firmus]MBG9601475.1 hypothetical protein [Cytobacillus firmus]MBG9654913.1 hypothetical protein [Cytobacillus firmus]MDD9310161.1 hypothetical protein [Cytobacillus firmus]MED1907145.1 hypothetical protein [Cytobacillus firmus]